MFNKAWVIDTIERAIKTAAQTFLVVSGLSESVTGVISVNWLAAVQVSLWAALASVLTSAISAKATNRDSASLVVNSIEEKK